MRRSLGLWCAAAQRAIDRLRSGDAALDYALETLTSFPANAAVTAASLDRITALDVSDDASQHVATQHAALLAAMRTHGAAEPAVGEQACRAVANMCMVPDAAPLDGSDADASAGVVTYASRLRADGAVQAVLAVAERGEALSDKGRAWVSLALLNLCMFDDGAAREASAANADVAAAVILRLATEAAEHAALAGREPSMADATAVRAALGIIPRLLSMQREGDAEAMFHYQRVTDVVVRSTVYALYARGRDDLEVAHKAWEALRLVSNEQRNHVLLYTALNDADGTSGAAVLQHWSESMLGAMAARQPHSADPETAHFQELQWNVLLCGLDTLVALTSPSDRGEHHLASDDDDSERILTGSQAALSSGAVSKFVTSLISATPLDTLAPRVSAGTRNEDVVVRCASLLGNLAETDPYVSTANCVTVVQRLLSQQVGDAAAERLLTVLWNVLNHREGADALRTLNVARTVAGLKQASASENVRVAAERLERKISAVVTEPRHAYDKAK